MYTKWQHQSAISPLTKLLWTCYYYYLLLLFHVLVVLLQEICAALKLRSLQGANYLVTEYQLSILLQVIVVVQYCCADCCKR